MSQLFGERKQLKIETSREVMEADVGKGYLIQENSNSWPMWPGRTSERMLSYMDKEIKENQHVTKFVN